MRPGKAPVARRSITPLSPRLRLGAHAQTCTADQGGRTQRGAASGPQPDVVEPCWFEGNSTPSNPTTAQPPQCLREREAFT